MATAIALSDISLVYFLDTAGIASLYRFTEIIARSRRVHQSMELPENGRQRSMRADWIFEDNLRPFLLSLSWFVGYEFDDSDWIAIRFGIDNTDLEHHRWYGYEFSGTSNARFELAGDPGTSVIHVRVEVPPEAAPRVEAAIAIFQTFRLTDDT